ncbi:hypothetical protein B7463_g3333, partial [Scytalidium lignicola]
MAEVIVYQEDSSSTTNQETSEPDIIEIEPDIELKRCIPPRSTFLRFPPGTIYIDLGGDKKYTYTFAKDTFMRAFPTLAESVDKFLTGEEAKATAQVFESTGYTNRYELRYNKGTGFWHLGRASWIRPKMIMTVSLPSRTQSVAVETVNTVDNETKDQVMTEAPSLPQEAPARDSVENPDAQKASSNNNSTSDIDKGQSGDVSVNKDDGSEKQPESSDKGKTALEEPPVVKTKPTISTDLFEAYNNLFLIIHNMTPKISIHPLTVSLPRVEILLDLASKYQNIHLIRSHISAELFQYGHELYVAIKNDPIRWLRIALDLQCKLIFREAVIHIVGQTPSIPRTAIPDYSPPDSIMVFLKNKTEQLRNLKNSIDKSLFESDIYVNGERLSLNNVDNSTFATWLVIQAWRDWFLQFHPSGFDKRSPELTAADRYRTIVKADDDSYLTVDSVRYSLEKHLGLTAEELDAMEIDEDIKLMKVAARELARPLVTNRILDDEYPWVATMDIC